eukprot:TRINITY_DN7741_c3_g1_i1.p1 TRINITY_DN7741_c3_g1~~TRINITY_DN7741_c3_g1_i1.p1  ORF type:complete len:656 (+),score=69.54 TRINITY_DN7741_c3_g1_i1:84-1970(+)
MKDFFSESTGLSHEAQEVLSLDGVAPVHEHGLHINIGHIEDSAGWNMSAKELAVTAEKEWETWSMATVVEKCDGLLFKDAIAEGVRRLPNEANVLCNLVSGNIERTLGVLARKEGLMFSEYLIDPLTEEKLPKGFLTILRCTMLPLGLNLRNVITHGYLHPVPLPYTKLLVVLCLRLHQSITPMTVKLVSPSLLLDPLKNISEYFEGGTTNFPIEEFLSGCEAMMESDCRFLPKNRFNDMKNAVLSANSHGEATLVRIVPLLEMTVRCWYCLAMNDFKSLVTRPGEYFATLDGHGQRHEHAVMLHEEPVTTAIGAPCSAILKDLFLSEDGPGLRGHIMHGKYNWNPSYPTSKTPPTPKEIRHAALLTSAAIVELIVEPGFMEKCFPKLHSWVERYPPHGLYSPESLSTPAQRRMEELQVFLSSNKVILCHDRVHIGKAKTHDDMGRTLPHDVFSLAKTLSGIGVDVDVVGEEGGELHNIWDEYVDIHSKMLEMVIKVEKVGPSADMRTAVLPPCQRQILRMVDALCYEALEHSRLSLERCALGVSLRTNQRRSLYKTHLMFLPSVFLLSQLAFSYTVRPGVHTASFSKILLSTLTLTLPHAKVSFSPDKLKSKLKLLTCAKGFLSTGM